MLGVLRIKNLALVEDLTLELAPGYVAITGETGAGKSILIGALNLLLGERADRNLIRSGCDTCSVEAVFEVGNLRRIVDPWLEQTGFDPEGDQLILKRSFGVSGTNRQFINGSPATLNQLADLGEHLVDLHGPHEHQSLLHPRQQLSLLDAFGGLGHLREDFRERLEARKQLLAERLALTDGDATSDQQLELLRHQVREIDAARLQPDEETTLESAYHRARHSAQLLELAQSALNEIDAEDASVVHQWSRIGRALQDIHRLDAEAQPLVQLHEQVSESVQQVRADLSRYAERIEVQPDQLQQLEERLNLLHGLKRKYGRDIPAIFQFQQAARVRLQRMESRESDLAQLQQRIDSLDAELRSVGRQLSAQRKRVVPDLARAVSNELSLLGFRQAEFEIKLTTEEPAPSADTVMSSGFDQVEFVFAPNPGESPRPLRAIASSGEMARVMLAIKTVLAVQDQVPVLIFDEVDANIGGETAGAVGRKMEQIGRHRQVLCITHLAPVAARAAAHYAVTKQVRDSRTYTEIRRLSEPERTAELARMLGGQGAEALRLAESLLRSPIEPTLASRSNRK